LVSKKIRNRKKYTAAYSTVLTNTKTTASFSHIYVDAFAGAGKHKLKKTGEEVLGSPFNALDIKFPFHEYHLIDINPEKTSYLKEATKDKTNVFVYNNDCNKILLEKIIPSVEYSRYKRGLFFLDPYGIHLDWKVIKAAGQQKTIEIFLNFSIMDMNMNVLKKDKNKVTVDQKNGRKLQGRTYSEIPPTLQLAFN